MRSHRVGIITFKCGGITKWPHFGCTLEIYKERTGREQQEEEQEEVQGHMEGRASRGQRETLCYETRRCCYPQGDSDEAPALCVLSGSQLQEGSPALLLIHAESLIIIRGLLKVSGVSPLEVNIMDLWSGQVKGKKKTKAVYFTSP